MGAVRVSVPFDAGMGKVARLEREKKFIGEELAGPAAAAAANAMMMVATDDFMLMVLRKERMLDDAKGFKKCGHVCVKEGVEEEKV